MGKQYKVVSINDVLENAALQTKEYNSKQEYYDDDKTYFQMFHDNAESIIKSTPSTSKYTSDETTGDLVLDLGNKKIDISNYTEEDYKALSDDLSHELAAKEILDTIKNDPDFSDLNRRLESGEISLDTDRVYASISYIGNNDGNEILPVGDLIFSIEPKEDCQASLNSDGFNYVATSSTTNEGVYCESLKDGLESTQSYLRTLEYEAEATLEIDEPEQKSRSSYRA
ncbi:hypothetical protein M2T32_25820 [Klebsiella pneumoniae]|uniref:hypothetical protein n=1 Tax=Enterobacteriaceae TaxID=543 RepID=UPI0012760F06|nr:MULTISPECIES: hypothetical protein [Klebsiella]EBS2638914.1 hypothetical protein [Salmonella enterica subsp. enterica serovar Agona]EDH7680951.1 hypothetical protein [Salmonella enterica subsp. enterica serovar Enteritidis]EDS6710118.1 hypothetical protein [Salmonella enterica subsp. enterica serovar Meleagridis]HBW1506108.1 hypothetical protein [Klebsiella quasipneumoniae subsp. similipneumoniae]ECD3145908.1 hypothetical protein [Salmonella enterica subsp. enterica serovar Agona]